MRSIVCSSLCSRYLARHATFPPHGSEGDSSRNVPSPWQWRRLVTQRSLPMAVKETRHATFPPHGSEGDSSRNVPSQWQRRRLVTQRSLPMAVKETRHATCPPHDSEGDSSRNAPSPWQWRRLDCLWHETIFSTLVHCQWCISILSNYCNFQLLVVVRSEVQFAIN